MEGLSRLPGLREGCRPPVRVHEFGPGLVQLLSSDPGPPLLPSSHWSFCQTCRPVGGHPPVPGSRACSSTWTRGKVVRGAQAGDVTYTVAASHLAQVLG